MFDTLKEIKLAMQIYLKVSGLQNWRSTLMGCISAVAGYLITVDWTNPLALKTAILPILAVIWGVVQKDGAVTGNTVDKPN
jgi:uncharacterized membrane protein HdeD (DUF308 family)